MSIKSATDEWVRKGPSQAIAVIAAAGILIGAVVGLGVGYKIEQSRTRNGVNRLHQQIKTLQQKLNTSAGGTRPTVAPVSRRVGKVTAAAAGSFTVSTKLGGSQVLVTSASTVFEKAVRGSVADVKVGSRVLVVSGGSEIMVLGAKSKLGRLVGKVAKTSIVVNAGNGLPAGTIKKSAVKLVSTLRSATSADIAPGTSVLAGGRPTTLTRLATIEIIVLPRGSRFAG